MARLRSAKRQKTVENDGPQLGRSKKTKNIKSLRQKTKDALNKKKNIDIDIVSDGEEERQKNVTKRRPTIRLPIIKCVGLEEEEEEEEKTNKKSRTKLKNKAKDGRKTKTVNLNLEEVLLRLHASAIPEELPCRETEYRSISLFVESNLLAGCSCSLYISGVPGTGKTATVGQVLNDLERRSDVPKFRRVEVNGMKLSQPSQVFVEILRQLSDSEKRVSVANAQRKLNELFAKSESRCSTVLVVDELDLLCTRRQEILYQIFDWATNSNAKLTVLAIANTLDLPERLLTQRVTSRLGMSRLCFQPYDHKQISSILASRLQC